MSSTYFIDFTATFTAVFTLAVTPAFTLAVTPAFAAAAGLHKTHCMIFLATSTVLAFHYATLVALFKKRFADLRRLHHGMRRWRGFTFAAYIELVRVEAGVKRFHVGCRYTRNAILVEDKSLRAVVVRHRDIRPSAGKNRVGAEDETVHHFHGDLPLYHSHSERPRVVRHPRDSIPSFIGSPRSSTKVCTGVSVKISVRISVRSSARFPRTRRGRIFLSKARVGAFFRACHFQQVGSHAFSNSGVPIVVIFPARVNVPVSRPIAFTLYAAPRFHMLPPADLEAPLGCNTLTKLCHCGRLAVCLGDGRNVVDPTAA